MSFSILVVDDEPTIRDFMRTILEDEGHRALEAGDGVEALAALEASAVDLMILDVMMPKMDGLQVCNHVRQSNSISHLPIIMISANDHSSMRETCLECGANAFFAKPMPFDELLDSVRDLLPSL